jgi:hypothetical protein
MLGNYFREINCLILITAPSFHSTGRTRVSKRTSAKICLESSRISSVTITITVKVTVAGISSYTRDRKFTSAKICLESSRIGSVTVFITVKISLTFTCITDPVAAGWKEVFLACIWCFGTIVCIIGDTIIVTVTG